MRAACRVSVCSVRSVGVCAFVLWAALAWAQGNGNGNANGQANNSPGRRTASELTPLLETGGIQVGSRGFRRRPSALSG